MFERFTDRARRVVVLAQQEAMLLSHNYVGTEHLLLGLVSEGDGVAARALARHGVDPEAVRAAIVVIVGEGAEAPSGHIPFTPRAKKVLELSLREAISLGHNYIGTEHILLGLIREGDGVAAQILVGLGLDPATVRGTLMELLPAGPSERASGLLPGEGMPATGVFVTQAEGFWPGPWVGTARQLVPWHLGLPALLFMTVSLVAVLSPRPATGLLRTGLILFIAGVVAAAVGAATQASPGRRLSRLWGRVPRWSNLAALLFFAGGTVAVLLDAALG